MILSYLNKPQSEKAELDAYAQCLKFKLKH